MTASIWNKKGKKGTAAKRAPIKNYTTPPNWRNTVVAGFSPF